SSDVCSSDLCKMIPCHPVMAGLLRRTKLAEQFFAGTLKAVGVSHVHLIMKETFQDNHFIDIPESAIHFSNSHQLLCGQTKPAHCTHTTQKTHRTKFHTVVVYERKFKSSVNLLEQNVTD